MKEIRRTGQESNFDVDRRNIVVQKVENSGSLGSLLGSGGLSNLYQEIFGAAPYFEKFTEEDVKSIFEEYILDGLLFVAQDGNDVVGFGAALPMQSVPAIENILQNSGIDTDNSWYMADLGVSEKTRKQGVGRQLVQNRINAIPENALIVMRTSVDNVASQALYKSLGFVQIENAYQEVEQARVDGTTATDKRLFLMRRK